ncbi:MAG: M20/M25/M40 family metallo-hydrolase [Acidimicrobiales bacterium]|nr:M20/M25/M40 family metallo-hydrolase [Acidimicrobiales bacterium]MDP6286990.1 M20/M25/M40 family metallo-hydrolase [Acidimicrobiales bacterium]MDP6910294.1 M20/M25/M40 family metallo-hydrolase [Acidimicrobiales bacterium]HJP23811.1 M20/M25/M40 family metallo-hydrolase [Acidimicrobiales bacterium]
MPSISIPSIPAVADLLGELVAYPTESCSPNVDFIDHYADRARRIGAAVDVVSGEAGRANLHLRFGPDAPGGILLSGHTDVVPAGTGWDTDPYVLTEVDGRLAARGTTDMKGFLAATLVLLEEIDVDSLRAPVHLGLSYDEEVGCIGVRGLLDVLATGSTGAGTCAPEVVVVGEPTGMRLCNAHAGKVAHRIDLTAASGHSSRAGTEPTAVHEGAALVALVQGLNDSDRGISANVGSIHGGVAVNVLAPSCTLEFEVRHRADTDPDEVLAGVLDAVADADRRLSAVGGRATSELFIGYPGLDTDPSLAPVVAMADLVGCGAPGTVAFGTEAGLYADRLGVPSVIVGPGDIADAHRPNETVAPDQLERCGDVLRRTIHRFCSDDGSAVAGTVPVDRLS